MTEPLIIAGYASLFGLPDLAGDVVERGAFQTSLRRLPAASIRMLYQHDPDRPIGRWIEAFEDQAGLWMKGLVEPNHPETQKIAALIQAGLADGLSIGFRTLEATPRPAGGRILKTIDLREVSIVTFPMLPRARFRVRGPTQSVRPSAPADLARQVQPPAAPAA
ncbi:HK97 family phage prohead protease [Aquidulcibacter sp.]|jgi:HK97 family phage prohead protease|uniref:HK97 family phage prohead protease n=1 Tax=Aquidulcibacter sp. TaxID=2052990 RepID=UPI000BC79C85|nr:MAG: protease [Alphaproteobacteria bacterium PA1]